MRSSDFPRLAQFFKTLWKPNKICLRVLLSLLAASVKPLPHSRLPSWRGLILPLCTGINSQWKHGTFSVNVYLVAIILWKFNTDVWMLVVSSICSSFILHFMCAWETACSPHNEHTNGEWLLCLDGEEETQEGMNLHILFSPSKLS